MFGTPAKHSDGLFTLPTLEKCSLSHTDRKWYPCTALAILAPKRCDTLVNKLACLSATHLVWSIAQDLTINYF